MTDPKLSVIVPTIGNPSLCRTLRSVLDAGFDPSRDELIVVSDGDGQKACAILAFYDRWIRAKFREGPKTGMVGQTQKNVGISLATGTHVLVMDDDDQYAPGALGTIRDVISKAPDRPHLFKMLACAPRHSYGECWRSKDIVVGNIGTPMLIAPNVPGRVGKFGEHYCGDYDFVRSTLDLYPDRDSSLVWVDRVIAYVY